MFIIGDVCLYIYRPRTNARRYVPPAPAVPVVSTTAEVAITTPAEETTTATTAAAQE